MQTKLSNLINPEVMADSIGANLPSAIKFNMIAEVDETLVARSGDSISIPRFAYIGDADDLTEGVAMGTVALSADTQKVTVKEAGKAVELTDKAVNSGYGDPVGEAENQLQLSIASKVDNDIVAALETSTLVYDPATLTKISYEVVVNALALFGEDDDEQKFLFIHSTQRPSIQLDPNFLAARPETVKTGVIGTFAGCEVIVSNRVPKRAADYSNYIVKKGAVAVYLKKETSVESDRDVLARTTVIAATKDYVAALKDESKSVLFYTSI